MAASLTQQAGLAVDSAFLLRVGMAMVGYAYTVENELVSVVSHAGRLALAQKVVQNPATFSSQFAVMLAAVDGAASTAYASTNPASQANVTDATIIADVAIGWNLIAGF